jgi:dTDP-4-dehydrorhamnose reductase
MTLDLMHITGKPGKLKKDSMKNILVIGAKGMLGYAVSSYFQLKNYNVTKLSRGEFDIAIDPMGKLEQYFSNLDVVINCAGVIKPMIEKNNIENVLKVNAIFPRNLAKLSNKHSVKCFHITTDCVYSGKKGKYSEEDFFDAEDAYGLSKNAGENSECMVLRTSIIGEENGQSRSLLEWAKSQAGKEVNGYTNHFWNGVTTVYLAEVIENILLNNMYQKGLFHIYSPNTVNKYELLQIFDSVYQLGLKINSITAKDSADRSMSSLFDLTSKVCIKELQLQVSEMNNFFRMIKSEISN